MKLKDILTEVSRRNFLKGAAGIVGTTLLGKGVPAQAVKIATREGYIDKGMTEREVEKAIGSPLRKDDLGDGNSFWTYSRDFQVQFQNHRVVDWGMPEGEELQNTLAMIDDLATKLNMEKFVVQARKNDWTNEEILHHLKQRDALQRR